MLECLSFLVCIYLSVKTQYLALSPQYHVLTCLKLVYFVKKKRYTIYIIDIFDIVSYTARYRYTVVSNLFPKNNYTIEGTPFEKR